MWHRDISLIREIPHHRMPENMGKIKIDNRHYICRKQKLHFVKYRSR